MKNVALIAALALSLVGCGLTEEGNLAREFVRDKGADAADALLKNTLWTLCNPMPIGAIRREFGNDEEMLAAYNKICAARQGRIALRP